MRFDLVTIFPRLCDGPLGEGIVKRAIDRGLVDVRVHDLRDYTTDRHRSVDDVSYGGGPGMVFKPEPLFRAVDAIKAGVSKTHIIDSALPHSLLLELFTDKGVGTEIVK